MRAGGGPSSPAPSGKGGHVPSPSLGTTRGSGLCHPPPFPPLHPCGGRCLRGGWIVLARGCSQVRSGWGGVQNPTLPPLRFDPKDSGGGRGGGEKGERTGLKGAAPPIKLTPPRGDARACGTHRRRRRRALPASLAPLGDAPGGQNASTSQKNHRDALE